MKLCLSHPRTDTCGHLRLHRNARTQKCECLTYVGPYDPCLPTLGFEEESQRVQGETRAQPEHPPLRYPHPLQASSTTFSPLCMSPQSTQNSISPMSKARERVGRGRGAADRQTDKRMFTPLVTESRSPSHFEKHNSRIKVLSTYVHPQRISLLASVARMLAHRCSYPYAPALYRAGIQEVTTSAYVRCRKFSSLVHWSMSAWWRRTSKWY